MTKKVLVPLAQGCEELEAVTIIDVLVRAGAEVVTASLDEEMEIQAARGTHLVAQTSLAQVEHVHFDCVALPGGLPGSDYLKADDRLRKILRRVCQKGDICAAICAAPQVLVSAGLLDKKSATSFPGVIDQNPALGMTYLNQPVVEDGQIITSRSAGTAMQFTLLLVQRLFGVEKRQQVESGLLP